MTTLDSPALNDQFGIAGHLTFRKGSGGMTVAEIGNLHASATIFLQGAHLASWNPRRQQPVIWLSPTAKFTAGKPIRGGVPVCWPWFASHPSEPTFPFHGFARTTPWTVSKTAKMDNGGTFISLRLPLEASRALWPYVTPVEIRFTVGQILDIELVTHNEGTEPVVIGQALHTYFRVGDVRQISIDGLDACVYLDKLENDQRKQQQGLVNIISETDRIYFDSGNDCQISDPSLKRRIFISKQGSRSTVVWNPWAENAAKISDMGEGCYANMVCVESANVADDAVTLLPGQEHKLWVRYSVENLQAG